MCFGFIKGQEIFIAMPAAYHDNCSFGTDSFKTKNL